MTLQQPLKGFLEFLQKSDADILAVQETKASPEQLSAALTAPEGYFAYFCSAERKGYSGVACFCKEKTETIVRRNSTLFDKTKRLLEQFDKIRQKAGGCRPTAAAWTCFAAAVDGKKQVL